MSIECKARGGSTGAKAAGVDLASVKELLGHSTVQMTMRYAHLAQDHLRAAME